MIKVGTIIGFYDLGTGKLSYGIIIKIDNKSSSYLVRIFRIALDICIWREYFKHSEWWININDIIYNEKESCSP